MFRFLIPGLPAALKSKALRILDTPPMWLNLVRPSISVGYRKPEGAAPQLSSSTHDFPPTQRPLTCPVELKPADYLSFCDTVRPAD